MSEAKQRDATPEEKARWAALARKYEAEADHAEYLAAKARLDLDKANQEAIRAGYADDYDDHTYRLLSGIDDASVHKCIKQLDAWHRGDPECKMTIIFDSPGGAVIPGFHLFDHILALRETHEINTVTRGYAASMGGILLQAGEKRSMGRNAHLMIHEVSFGASGKIGDVEDGVEFAKLLWNRALDIFADRCSASNAVKPLSRASLVNRSKRKNWWIKATDALAFGLVDEVA
jgi:ATP-dependent Clp endopeptidase proteolytic subunit ClpP